TPNPYIHYKSLANIYILLNDLNKSKMYREKSIEVKRNQRTGFTYNTAEDYNNLAATYLLQKDTVGMLNVFLEKIKAAPCINPDPDDYMKVARYYLFRNDLVKAKEQLRVATEIYPNFTDANLCRAAEAIVNDNKDDAQFYLEEDLKVSADPHSLHLIIGLFSIMTNHADNAFDWLSESKLTSPHPTEIQREYIDRFLLPAKN
ncbi:MAG: hypothetical protein IAF38_03735, partial [Bacteroidia bacterium]|nr:hypothetical protein [Bacteroidia bacterium]